MSAAISTAISLALLFGNPTLSAAASCVIWVTIFLGLSALLMGLVEDKDRIKMKRHWWISFASSAFALYAIIETGHSILAAAYFVTTAAIILVVFKEE